MRSESAVRWAVLVAAVAGACGESANPNAPQDAGGEVVADKAVGNDAPAQQDVPAPQDVPADAGPDAAKDAVAVDAMADAAKDVPAADAAPEAGSDGGSEAGPDAAVDASVDAGADASRDDGADAELDAGTDVGMDATADLPMDADAAAPDAGIDATSDAPDAAVDTAPDVAPDTPADVAPDAAVDAGCSADVDCGAGRVCVARACVLRGGGAFFPPAPAGFAASPSLAVSGCVQPIGLTFAADGTLYATCITEGRVVRIDPVTGAVATVATGFTEPLMLRFADARTLVVTDRAAGQVRRVPLGADGLGAGPTALLGSGWSAPCGLTVESGGALLVLNQSSGALDRITLAGAVTRGVLTGAPNAVEAEFDPAGRLWLTEYGSEVYTYDATLRREQTLTGFDHPVGVVFDAAGNAYVSNSRFGGPGATVIRVTPAGARSDVITGLSWPHDVVFDARGNLWVADYGSNRVLRFDAR